MEAGVRSGEDDEGHAGEFAVNCCQNEQTNLRFVVIQRQHVYGTYLHGDLFPFIIGNE